MVNFTIEEYDQAIDALTNARKQLTEDTQHNGCLVCGGDHHPDTCGFNPLYAQHLCNLMSEQCHDLHETMHLMSGFHTYMGESVGIASIRSPKVDGSEGE